MVEGGAPPNPLFVEDVSAFTRLRLFHPRDHEELVHWLVGMSTCQGGGVGFSPDLLVVEDLGHFARAEEQQQVLTEPRLTGILSLLANLVACRSSMRLLAGLSADEAALRKRLAPWASELWRLDVGSGGSGIEVVREVAEWGRLVLKMEEREEEYRPLTLEREYTKGSKSK